MELNESKMNKAFKNTRFLGDFLFEYANLESIAGGVSVDELPGNAIIELVDWWKKRNKSQKHTIQVGPGPATYLNVHWDPIDICVGNMSETGYWRGVFNRQEIKELKKRDDIAIDWDKAIIEPV